MSDGFVFNAGSDVVVQSLTTRLTQQGLSLVRSFDLRSALTHHPECECPHHGTAHCSCQFVVLLIFGNVAEPAVLTLHSHDGRTWASVVHDATTRPDPSLAEEIRTGLTETGLTLENASIQNTDSDRPG